MVGLLERLRKPRASHLSVKVATSIVRCGEEVVARAAVADPDALHGSLVVGLRCRRKQRRMGVGPSGQTIADPLFETYDRHEVHAEWRELDGRGPWEVRFTVPETGPPSSDRRRGKHAWRVELRERRAGARDPSAHASLIVK